MSRIVPPPNAVIVPSKAAMSGAMRKLSAFSVPTTAKSASPAASSVRISGKGQHHHAEDIEPGGDGRQSTLRAAGEGRDEEDAVDLIPGVQHLQSLTASCGTRVTS
jgi:hypothetical protein